LGERAIVLGRSSFLVGMVPYYPRAIAGIAIGR
jgi:hypothetical protein